MDIFYSSFVTFTHWNIRLLILLFYFLIYAFKAKSALDFPGGANLPANAWGIETRIWSLGQEDLLEKEKAPHSSILAGRIPQTEEPVVLQSMGSQTDTTECLSTQSYETHDYYLALFHTFW